MFVTRSLVQSPHFLYPLTQEEGADTFFFFFFPFHPAGLTSESYDWNGKPAQDLSLSNLFWLGLYNSSNVDYSDGNSRACSFGKHDWSKLSECDEGSPSNSGSSWNGEFY